MDMAENESDFEHAATLPERPSPHTALLTMCKRIDALCGPCGDDEVAARYGVDTSMVSALRHDISLVDTAQSDAYRFITGLALDTGVSVDWLMGRAQKVSHTEVSRYVNAALLKFLVAQKR